MSKCPARMILWIVALVCTWKAVGPSRAADWRSRLAEPAPEFSQMPFWFWNDELSDEEIRRQLADFRDHGVYGFVIHARMGLPREIPYMKERWLHHVRTAVEEAARTGMRVCLYDEGMYPSGSAHGEVVRSNPAFAAKGLLVTHQDVDGPIVAPIPTTEGQAVAVVVARRSGEGRELQLSKLRLVETGASTAQLAEGSWRIMVFSCVPSEGRIRGVHEGEEDRDPGAPAAADLLDPAAMQAFIRFAYEPYAATLKDHFGKTVIGMFTDEPSMLGRGGRRGLKPWTDGLAGYFERQCGYALPPVLPALFFNIGERTESIRADFERTLGRRLDETYYQPLSEWCGRHGIGLTGHPAGATEIWPLRYFQIPGQDIVWRGVVPLPEKPTALEGPNSALGKCSSSVARHDRRRRNSNEVYGAYGWRLTLEEMKWLADWLMVRGVNLFYPHAFYYSIRDDRVHERPPDVGPNNAWWPHYKPFADYTSRLCGLLTDSRQVCEVAILGGNHDLPWRAAKWLYQNQVDFNYLEDWRLIEHQAEVRDGRILAGEMAYRILIVDRDEPLAGPIAERVDALADAGVQVRYCRGEPTAAVVQSLVRDIRADPAAPDLRYVHLVKEGIDFYLLVNEGDRPIETRVTVGCQGAAEWFDAWTGAFRLARVTGQSGDGMTVPIHLERRESLVLCIDSSQAAKVTEAKATHVVSEATLVIEGPWRIVGPDGVVVGNRLGDWRQVPETANFAGSLRYQTAFDLKMQPEHRYVLDLGGVGDFAVVRLNGRDLGARFWAPYRWKVADILRDGTNELTIEVTNSLANRYDSGNARPSGLFGPVELRSYPRGR